MKYSLRKQAVKYGTSVCYDDERDGEDFHEDSTRRGWSAGSKNKRVANGSPATHQTLRQQGGPADDSHIHLADWTRSVAAIETEEVLTNTTANSGAGPQHISAEL